MLSATALMSQLSPSSNTHPFNSELFMGIQRGSHLYGTAQKVPSRSELEQFWYHHVCCLPLIKHGLTVPIPQQPETILILNLFLGLLLLLNNREAKVNLKPEISVHMSLIYKWSNRFSGRNCHSVNVIQVLIKLKSYIYFLTPSTVSILSFNMVHPTWWHVWVSRFIS